MKKRAVILGAGISGLAAGYVLSKKGFETLVLEKGANTGGLAATFEHKSYFLDFGPHNFHTRFPGVLDFVKNELHVSLQRIPVSSSKLFFMGKFIEYPFKINTFMRNLSFAVSLRCIFEYLACRIKRRLFPRKQVDSFEVWVKSHFGSYLYNLYFGPYVRKVWGILGSRLDAVVARKRIPEPSLFSFLARSVSRKKVFRGHSEDPSAIESYYPPGGIGVIAENLKEGIASRNGKVLTRCQVASIALPQQRSGEGSVCYRIDGIKQEAPFDLLISTIPLTTLGELSWYRDERVLADETSRLSYRSIILLYLFLDMERLFEDPWIYFNERGSPALIFNRLYEIGNFSRQMTHHNKTCVCLEITCCEGDAVWNTPDESLFESCMAYLEKNNLLKKSQVREILVKRLEVAYPVFEIGYRSHVRKALESCFAFGNILPLGRQGLFSYSNIDHCIDMGLKLEKLFASGDLEVRPNVFFELYNNYLC